MAFAPPQAPPPPHWSLLYVIGIETSIKTCLLLGTKESDILQWGILWRLQTFWISLRQSSICAKENFISASNYTARSLLPNHILSTCPAAFPSLRDVYLTLLAFACVRRICSHLRCVCSAHEQCLCHARHRYNMSAGKSSGIPKRWRDNGGLCFRLPAPPMSSAGLNVCLCHGY